MSTGIPSTPRADGRRSDSGAAKQKERDYYLKDSRGNVLGGNYMIPDGDFARVLGWAPPTAQEAAGKQQVSATRAIELALEKKIQDVGERAQKSGMSFRNEYVTWGRFENEPGRERDLLKDGLDAVQQGQEKLQGPQVLGQLGGTSSANYFKLLEQYHEKSKEDNMRYLEMQYKFMYAGKSHGTVSNLMKVRHDAIKKAISDTR